MNYIGLWSSLLRRFAEFKGTMVFVWKSTSFDRMQGAWKLLQWMKPISSRLVATQPPPCTMSMHQQPTRCTSSNSSSSPAPSSKHHATHPALAVNNNRLHLQRATFSAQHREHATARPTTLFSVTVITIVKVASSSALEMHNQ